MDLTDDRNLYLLLREGDEHAFQTLFKKFYPALCHFANQFLADKEQSEEIVQEIFVKIWEKRSVLNIETSVKHYLFRSVRNQCLNQIQHEKIKKQYATKVLENAQMIGVIFLMGLMVLIFGNDIYKAIVGKF